MQNRASLLHPAFGRRLKQISEMRRRDDGARQLRAAELYEDIHDSMVPKAFDSEAVLANLDQVRFACECGIGFHLLGSHSQLSCDAAIPHAHPWPSSTSI